MKGHALWKADHPYYGTGEQTDYKSWAEFLNEWGPADEDLNLPYRWDWLFEEDDDGKPKESSDPNYRDGLLHIFFIIQRKGRINEAVISVCKNDEPKVRAYLNERFSYLKKLWEPL